MCNLCFQTKSQDAMRHVFDGARDHMSEIGGDLVKDVTGGLPPLAGILPDCAAPVLRLTPDGRLLQAMAHWGMPTLRLFLTGKRTDPGVTIRSVATPHGQCWLAVQRPLPDGALDIILGGAREDTV